MTQEELRQGMQREACYADCLGCQADLCAVIEFRERTPEALISLTAESDWPEGYPCCP